MKQFFNDLDLDIYAITKTWLKEGDKVGKATLKLGGMKSFLHHTHQDQVGELQSYIRKMYALPSHIFTSFGPVNTHILKLALINVHIQVDPT